jgi:hypothetical protein
LPAFPLSQSESAGKVYSVKGSRLIEVVLPDYLLVLASRSALGEWTSGAKRNGRSNNMDEHSPTFEPEQPLPGDVQAARRTMSWLLGAMLGLVTLLMGAIFVLILLRRDPLPPLTREQFDQARRTWQQNGPASYDLEVTVSGRQAATYGVQVRGHEAYSATRNGRPLTQQRTYGTWSVPGMFNTIESDIENVEKVAAGQAVQQTPQLALRAQFDSHYGYPVRYHRIEKTKFGSNPEVSWRVDSFEEIRP